MQNLSKVKEVWSLSALKQTDTLCLLEEIIKDWYDGWSAVPSAPAVAIM